MTTENNDTNKKIVCATATSMYKIATMERVTDTTGVKIVPAMVFFIPCLLSAACWKALFVFPMIIEIKNNNNIPAAILIKLADKGSICSFNTACSKNHFFTG